MIGLLHRLQHPAAPVPAAVVSASPCQAAPAAAAQPPPPGRPVIYGCFTCPWCYLASQHSDQLADPLDGPQWRMVVPEPHPPVTGTRLDAADRSRLEDELAAVGVMLLPGEQLPSQAPAFVPYTSPAVAGYAEACGAGVEDVVRRLLFDAYWQHDADIGNPEVLRRLLAAPIRAGHSASWPLRESGYVVSLAGGPITTGAYDHMRNWQADWLHAAGGAVPAMVGGGTPITGPDVVRALEAIILAGPDKAPGPLAGRETPAWTIARDIETSFLSARGPVFEGIGAVSAYGSIRPTISEPGKPDGEVAT